MVERHVYWTANEIDMCSDQIGEHFRFVSKRKNPNNKELYYKLLSKKLQELTMDNENGKFYFNGYKGFEKDFVTIYAKCPHSVKTTLKYKADDHAPNTALRMKWNTSCKKCFIPEASPAVLAQVPSDSLPKEDFEPSGESLIFGLEESIQYTEQEIHTVPEQSGLTNSEVVSKNFDYAMEKVIQYMEKTKQSYISANTPVEKVMSERAEIGLGLQSCFLEAFKIPEIYLLYNDELALPCNENYGKIDELVPDLENNTLQTDNSVILGDITNEVVSLKTVGQSIPEMQGAAAAQSSCNRSPVDANHNKNKNKSPKALASILKQKENLEQN